MGRDRLTGKYEKMLSEIFEVELRKMNAWQAWTYLIDAMAIGLSNALDPNKMRWEKREKEFYECTSHLEKGTAANMLAVVALALEENPGQDFLGNMFMALELGSHWHGQFFTPYHLAAAMADTGIDEQQARDTIEQQGFTSVTDYACGAGATLIGAVEALKKRGVDYQNSVCFTANDIDRTTAQMCFIQLSLLGCAGYVTVADGLSHPVEGDVLFPREEGQEFWYTPMWWSDTWKTRRAIERARHGRQGISGRTRHDDMPIRSD